MTTDEETIRAYFEPFLDLDPTRFDDLLRDLDGAIAAMEHEDMGKIDDVANDVSDWEGPAADSFNEQRLATFTPIKDHQINLTKELILAAAASREVALRAQKDVIIIVMGAEAALESLDNGCGCSKDELTKILGIIGAIAAAIGGIAGILGALGAGAAAGSFAAGLGVAGARIGAGGATLGFLNATVSGANNFNSSGGEIALKGDTVEEVLESARKAIEELNKGMDDQEGKIKDALGADAKLLTDQGLQIADIDLTPCDFRPPS